MKKLLIYVVAYNHESFIEKTLSRIDESLFDNYETEILVNDDSSKDDTLRILMKIKKNFNKKVQFTILSNPKNLGYGGNQKIGYFYAIKYNFDYVVLLHGDGQYKPEIMGDLLEILEKENAKAVFGSRMISKFGALKGGMPIYKFIGNKILTYLQNKILKSNLSEFHSGYRVYDVQALKKIPFYLNSNDFSFDTEIIIQFLILKLKISEVPIPTYYGKEISYVNGLYYAYRIIIESLKSNIQKFGMLYEKKYDLIDNEVKYVYKKNFTSTHSISFKTIKNNSLILDVGSGQGDLIRHLVDEKNCKVIGIDKNAKTISSKNIEFVSCDLNKELPNLDYLKFDYILFLDVIEHLENPEDFLKKLYEKISENEKIEIIISTPNISFFIIRFMLLFGFFNYGKRGILDKTHTRLFTFQSFKKLIEDSNYKIIKTIGIPAPFPLAIGENLLSKILINFNNLVINIWRSFFSYQILCKIKPNKSLNLLLKKAEKKVSNTT
jgi:glycosyltransferase involved in cell wall biosynthesis